MTRCLRQRSKIRAPLHEILEEARGRNERDVACRPSPREKNGRNVSDWSGQNSEDKTASLPLVRGPANQSRDLNSRAHDDSSISVGLGGSSYGSKTSAERSLKDGVPLDQQLQNPAVHAAIHGQRCRANPIVQRQRWMRTFPLILKVVILKRSL